jgi:hypothetical protein
MYQQQNMEDYVSSTSSSSLSTGSSRNLPIVGEQGQPRRHQHGDAHTVNLPIHGENLSKFPESKLPHTAPIFKTSAGTTETTKNSQSFGSSSSRLSSMFSALWTGKRKKRPTTGDVKQTLDKLDKLTTKTVKQEVKMMETLREWGLGLPDSASRDLVANISNILTGKLNPALTPLCRKMAMDLIFAQKS